MNLQGNGSAGKKVLIVDDDKGLVSILEARFLADGFEVLTAFDGEDGLGKIEQGCPDLVILDILMPRKDGLQVLKEIRRIDSAFRHLPVIIMSGKAELEHLFGSYEICAFIIKPFEARRLLEEVRRML